MKEHVAWCISVANECFGGTAEVKIKLHRQKQISRVDLLF